MISYRQESEFLAIARKCRYKIHNIGYGGSDPEGLRQPMHITQTTEELKRCGFALQSENELQYLKVNRLREGKREATPYRQESWLLATARKYRYRIHNIRYGGSVPEGRCQPRRQRGVRPDAGPFASFERGRQAERDCPLRLLVCPAPVNMALCGKGGKVWIQNYLN